MGARVSSGNFKAILPSEAPSTNSSVAKPKKYTREELKLMRTLLPPFVFLEKSTQAHRDIAGAHWERIFAAAQQSKTSNSSQRETKATDTQSSKIMQLYDLFFAYLEEHSPDLRPVFRSSMQVRGKVLVHISIGMRSLMASENFVDKVLPLTKTHRRFGVKLEHYEPLGKALFYAMEKVSGKEWTPEVEDAWKRLFSHTSVILMRAQRRVDARVAREAAKPIGPGRRIVLAAVAPGTQKPSKKSSVLPFVTDLVPQFMLTRRGSARETALGGTSVPSGITFSANVSAIGDTDAGSRYADASTAGEY